MEEIGVRYLSLTKREIDHCSDLAKQTNNFSYHHSLYCLLLWREREQIVSGATLLKQCLFYHLREASINTGRIKQDDIAFLQDQEEEVCWIYILPSNMVRLKRSYF